MSGFIKVTLEGDKWLMERLNSLGKRAAKKVLRAALTKTGRVVVKAVKASFPAEGKRLKKTVRANVKVNQKAGLLCKVGVNVKAKPDRTQLDSEGRPPLPRHATIYVVGTKYRRHKETQHPTGISPAHPVVDEGWARSQSQARNTLVNGILDGVKAEAEKLKLKAK